MTDHEQTRQAVAKAIYRAWHNIPAKGSDRFDDPTLYPGTRELAGRMADAAIAVLESATPGPESVDPDYTIRPVAAETFETNATPGPAPVSEAERLTRLARIVLSTSDYLDAVYEPLKWSDLAGPNVIPSRKAMESAWAALSDDDRAYLTIVRLESEQKETIS